MRLVAITVVGFRSLSDVGPIPVRQPTILAGQNDSGKSAVLDALAFLLEAYQLNAEDPTFCEASDEDLPPEARPRVSTTQVIGEFHLSEIEQASLALPEIVKIRRVKVGSNAPVLQIEASVAEDIKLRDLQSKTVSVLKDLARDYDVTIRSTASKTELVGKLEAFVATQPSTRDWATTIAEVRGALPQLLRFGDADSAEAAVKTALTSRYREHLDSDDLKQQVKGLEVELRNRLREDAEDLVAHIKQRCPDLVTVSVEPDVSFTGGLQRTKLRLARTDGEEVSLAAAGAGRTRRISLAIWEWTSEILRGEAPSEAASHSARDLVIVYDEPDTHLDYLQQRRVMRLIREQCDINGVAMVIATHSMNLIDGAAIDDIVHLRLENERTQIERLLDDSDDRGNRQHLADIAAALGLRNTVLLHERCFVGVEGPTEQQSMPILFKVATGKSLPACGIVIVACNNNEGALNFVGFLARSGRQTLLIVDADSRRNRLFNDTRLVAAGLKPDDHVRVVGSPDKELEYIFSDAQWASVANDAWPRNDGALWQNANIAALRSSKKFSDGLLDLFKVNSDSGPSSKTALVYELSRSLKSPEDVPAALRDAFADLERLAALDS